MKAREQPVAFLLQRLVPRSLARQRVPQLTDPLDDGQLGRQADIQLGQRRVQCLDAPLALLLELRQQRLALLSLALRRHQEHLGVLQTLLQRLNLDGRGLQLLGALLDLRERLLERHVPALRKLGQLRLERACRRRLQRRRLVLKRHRPCSSRGLQLHLEHGGLRPELLARFDSLALGERAHALGRAARRRVERVLRALGEHRQHILGRCLPEGLRRGTLGAGVQQEGIERVVHHIIDACQRVLQPMRPRRLLLLHLLLRPHILLCRTHVMMARPRPHQAYGADIAALG